VIHLLYQALGTDKGIEIETDNVQLCVQKLHAARRKANDEALEDLVIAISRTDPTSKVWIIRKNEEPGGQEE
jgi:hypothetical protein